MFLDNIDFIVVESDGCIYKHNQRLVNGLSKESNIAIIKYKYVDELFSFFEDKGEELLGKLVISRRVELTGDDVVSAEGSIREFLKHRDLEALKSRNCFLHFNDSGSLSLVFLDGDNIIGSGVWSYKKIMHDIYIVEILKISAGKYRTTVEHKHQSAFAQGLEKEGILYNPIEFLKCVNYIRLDFDEENDTVISLLGRVGCPIGVEKIYHTSTINALSKDSLNIATPGVKITNIFNVVAGDSDYYMDFEISKDEIKHQVGVSMSFLSSQNYEEGFITSAHYRGYIGNFQNKNKELAVGSVNLDVEVDENGLFEVFCAMMNNIVDSIV